MADRGPLSKVERETNNIVGVIRTPRWSSSSPRFHYSAESRRYFGEEIFDHISLVMYLGLLLQERAAAEWARGQILATQI